MLRMLVLYMVAAWLIMQVAEVVIALANLPDWIGPGILGLLAIGFPIALTFSWFYEQTPEGMKLEKDVDPAASITWAVNGAASVAAPALAMLVSMVWGFSATLYLGTAVYAVATLLLLSFSHMLDPKREALAQQANSEPVDGSGSSPVGQGRGGRREPQPRQRALEWSR